MSRVAIAIGIMGALLFGCEQGQSSGQIQPNRPRHKFDKYAVGALPVGTAQAEVLREFGAPQHKRTAEDGTDVWTFLKLGYTQPVETTRTGVEGVDLNQRTIEAPSLSEWKPGGIGSIYMGEPMSKIASLRFRDGKLVKAEIFSPPRRF